MDGTTEPILTVIGHPIAGNPSQLALERALGAMQLEWRVLSFDVKPGDVAKALDGFSVTGITGVMIDPSIADEASQWYAEKTQTRSAAAGDPSDEEAENVNVESEPESIDCLFRDPELDGFSGGHELKKWIEATISECDAENKILLGNLPPGISLSEELVGESVSLPPDPETIGGAGLITIGELSGESALEAEEWPKNDGSTIVLDLTSGHSQLALIQRLGYRVVTEMDRRIGVLHRCLMQWTGQSCSEEVIRDAIEEYLGV